MEQPNTDPEDIEIDTPEEIDSELLEDNSEPDNIEPPSKEFKEGSESISFRFQGIEITLGSARFGVDILSDLAFNLYTELKKTNGKNGSSYTG